MATILNLFIVGLGVQWLETYVLTLMWEWFLTPLGLPRIGMWQMFGINLLVNLIVLRKDTTSTKDLSTTEKATKLFSWVVYVLVVWLGAWIAHRGM